MPDWQTDPIPVPPQNGDPADVAARMYRDPYAVWPEWVKGFRQHQVDAVELIIDAYQRGKRIVVLDAPVGSGKTLIAEMVRRRLQSDALYVAHSRSLQDQFLADFPYARVMKGRSNYATERMPWPQFTGDDCTGAACAYCSDVNVCPYRSAKAKARGARVAVVNTAYFLNEAQSMNALCSGRQFVVVDECDTMEGILLDQVGFGVHERGSYGLTPPKKGAHGPTVAKWVRDEWLPAARGEMADITHQIQRTRGDADRVKLARMRKRLVARIANATVAAQGIETDGWVRDYHDRYALMLKPVMVDWAADKRVWAHGDRWLMMSGTVVDGDVMMRGLGVEREDWELVTVPMVFDVENRRVRVVPVGDMSRKGTEEEQGDVVRVVREVCDRHRGENVLVHTVSYPLTRRVMSELVQWAREARVKLHTYNAASERESALERFKREGGVMVGPSLDRGVDLPGDLCRVQVVVKVPFPYLGDRQIQARMRTEGGQRWYATETARTLVQMTGRGVRGADDWCVTYIVDKGFMRWYVADGKRLLPKWWQDAVKMERVKDYLP